MAVEIQWDNEERTLMRLEYSETWTWEELYDAQSLVNRMADEVEHPFDVMHDLRQTAHLPPGAFANLRTLMFRMHSRIRANVYIGMNPFVRAVWNSFTLVYSPLSRGKKFFFAETPNHARIMLEDTFEMQR